MQQSGTKEMQGMPDWVGKVVNLELCKKIKIVNKD